MPRPVTLRTIADALGVSQTTVSNAYNRPDQLAPELRERILAAARELGYSGPDAAARRLRSGRAGALGVLLAGSVAEPAAAHLLEGLARATGLGLLLVPEDGVRDAVVDGFCLHALPPGHRAAAAAAARRLPLVVVGGQRLDGHPLVRVDERAGARAAAAHVIGLGHRRLAILGDGPAERLAGYREAIAAAGLDPDAVPARPTAVLAVTDDLALEAIEAARRAGLRVPEDRSVVGFGDDPAATWARLTTVRRPLLEAGEAAGRLLTGAGPPQDVVLRPELVVRGSTAPPAA